VFLPDCRESGGRFPIWSRKINEPLGVSIGVGKLHTRNGKTVVPANFSPTIRKVERVGCDATAATRAHAGSQPVRIAKINKIKKTTKPNRLAFIIIQEPLGRRELAAFGSEYS
jgi:hypothetical protein